MGGSSKDSGSSGGNDGGNNDKPAKKATPKKKVNNGTSKYFKKTSTPKKAAPKAKNNNRNRTYSAPLPKAKKKVVAPKPVQRQGSPHERNRDYRPPTPTVSTAVTKAVPKYNVRKLPTNLIDPTPVALPADQNPAGIRDKENAEIDKAFADRKARNDRNRGDQHPPMDAMSARKGEQERFTSPTPAAVKPKDKATPKGGKGHLNSIKGLNDPSSHKALLGAYQSNDKPRDAFNTGSYNEKAKSSKESINPMVSDKYRNDEVSYNQAYWKGKKDGGASQADMAAEQKSLGSKKIYSGDRAITKNDRRKSKYILDSLEKSDIKPTSTTETSGLFGERQTTTNSYDIGTGKPMTSTVDKYSPTLGGIRFGDDITRTYANGVAAWEERGDGTTSNTTEAKLGALNDRVDASPDQAIAELADIDEQIKNETDPGKLKALHQRRMALMRMTRTNTRFAGLLDDADIKRSKMSIL